MVYEIPRTIHTKLVNLHFGVSMCACVGRNERTRISNEGFNSSKVQLVLTICHVDATFFKKGHILKYFLKR